MSIGEKASSSASSQSVEAATGAAPVDKKAAAAAARAARPAVPLFSYVLPLVLAAAHAYFLWHVWVTEFRGRLPAVSSATAVVAVPIAGTAAYVLSVLLGRRWMLSPGAVAWDVRPFQHVYNVYITALSLTMLVLLGRETLWPALATGGPLWLSKLDATTGGAPLAFALWLNYHSKYLEYADTLFIILSRKSDQLSFLHVEHHAVMVPVMCVGWGDARVGGCGACEHVHAPARCQRALCFTPPPNPLGTLFLHSAPAGSRTLLPRAMRSSSA